MLDFVASSTSRTPRSVRRRLALLMLLQYAPMGAAIPLFSLQLKEIGFSSQEIGWCWATQALGGIVGPPVMGQFADRWFPTQHCLAACGILAAGLYWLLAGLTNFWLVFPTALALWLVAGPTSSLATSLCFANLNESQKEFGSIRVWGTLGWGLSCIVLGIWLRQPVWLQTWTGFSGPRPLSDIFRIAAILSFCLGIYALTLPHTPPRPLADYRFALMGAFQLFRLPSFAITWVVFVGVALTTPFYQQITPLLLAALGGRNSNISMLLSLAQLLEIAGLLLHARLLHAWGYRHLMLVGIAAWTSMFLLDTVGQPFELIVGGLLLNGVCISCFTITSQLYCNRLSHHSFRTSAQAVLALSTGVAMLVGSVLAGFIRGQTPGQFLLVYGTAAAIMVGCLAYFAWGFREEK